MAGNRWPVIVIMRVLQVEDVSYISTVSSDFLGPHSAYRTHLFASLHLVHNTADREAPEGQHGHVGAALERRRVELHAEVGLRDGRRGTRDRSRLKGEEVVDRRSLGRQQRRDGKQRQ